MEIVDNEWRQDELPYDQILVPTEKLPDPEADNGDPHLTLSEQVHYIAIPFPFFFYLYYFITGTKMDRFGINNISS